MFITVAGVAANGHILFRSHTDILAHRDLRPFDSNCLSKTKICRYTITVQVNGISAWFLIFDRRIDKLQIGLISLMFKTIKNLPPTPCSNHILPRRKWSFIASLSCFPVIHLAVRCKNLRFRPVQISKNILIILLSKWREVFIIKSAK